MTRRERLLLGAIVAIAIALRALHPGADPPLSLSDSNAEFMDGPWYMAEALDRVQGRTAGATDLPPQYRRPIFTALMRLGFIGGASLERAHLVEALTGGLLIVLVAGATRRAFGTRAALIAAALLAVGFVPVGYARTTVVYEPLAAALAGVFWLLALPAPWLAVLCLIAIAAGLQAMAILMAPALVVALYEPSARRVLILAVLGAAAATAVMAFSTIESSLVDITVAKAVAYLGPVEPLEMIKRWLRAPFASGLWPKAPVLCALAWIGVFAAAAGGTRTDGPVRLLLRALAVWFVAWVAVLSVFQYIEGGPPPLRYFMPALVPAAILAGWLVDRLLSDEGVAFPTTPAFVFVWAALGFYWLLGTILTLLWPLVVGDRVPPAWLENSVSFGGLLSAALVFGGGIAWFAAPRWRGRHYRLPIAWGALIAGAAIAADGARLYPMLAHPTYTLRDANRVVAQLVGPGATLFGPYAHALTYNAPGISRHMEAFDYRTEEGALRPRREGWTHLAVGREDGDKLERVYESLDLGLIELGEVDVRGYPIRIYRFRWAEESGYRLSARERQLDR